MHYRNQIHPLHFTGHEQDRLRRLDSSSPNSAAASDKPARPPPSSSLAVRWVQNSYSDWTPRYLVDEITRRIDRITKEGLRCRIRLVVERERRAYGIIQPLRHTWQNKHLAPPWFVRKVMGRGNYGFYHVGLNSCSIEGDDEARMHLDRLLRFWGCLAASATPPAIDSDDEHDGVWKSKQWRATLRVKYVNPNTFVAHIADDDPCFGRHWYSYLYLRQWYSCHSSENWWEEPCPITMSM